MPHIRRSLTSFAALVLLAAVAAPGCGSLEDLADDLLSHHSGGGGGGTQCSYGGKEYPIGASFPSQDGCNTCSCDMGGVACTEKACGTGGSTGMGPTCEKLMVPTAGAGCSSSGDLKQASARACADKMEALTDMELLGICADGASAQAAIAICCPPTPPPSGTSISCSPGMQPSGAPCTVCVDASGTVVKTDCAR